MNLLEDERDKFISNIRSDLILLKSVDTEFYDQLVKLLFKYEDYKYSRGWTSNTYNAFFRIISKRERDKKKVSDEEYDEMHKDILNLSRINKIAMENLVGIIKRNVTYNDLSIGYTRLAELILEVDDFRAGKHLDGLKWKVNEGNKGEFENAIERLDVKQLLLLKVYLDGDDLGLEIIDRAISKR